MFKQTVFVLGIVKYPFEFLYYTSISFLVLLSGKKPWVICPSLL
jgi:hypothetical protein